MRIGSLIRLKEGYKSYGEVFLILSQTSEDGYGPCFKLLDPEGTIKFLSFRSVFAYEVVE